MGRGFKSLPRYQLGQPKTLMQRIFLDWRE